MFVCLFFGFFSVMGLFYFILIYFGFILCLFVCLFFGFFSLSVMGFFSCCYHPGHASGMPQGMWFFR